MLSKQEVIEKAWKILGKQLIVAESGIIYLGYCIQVWFVEYGINYTACFYRNDNAYAFYIDGNKAVDL